MACAQFGTELQQNEFGQNFSYWLLKPLWNRPLATHPHSNGGRQYPDYRWWRHQMESFAALLAICSGNSPVTGEFPAQSQWRGALMFSLTCAWINVSVNNGEAGELERHHAHYDVTVMSHDAADKPANYLIFESTITIHYPFKCRSLHIHIPESTLGHPCAYWYFGPWRCQAISNQNADC